MTGKVASVVGGATGIGLAAARALAEGRGAMFGIQAALPVLSEGAGYPGSTKGGLP